jgi:hypothetical protein
MRTMKEALQAGSPFDIEYRVRDIDAGGNGCDLEGSRALVRWRRLFAGTGLWRTSVSGQETEEIL